MTNKKQLSKKQKKQKIITEIFDPKITKKERQKLIKNNPQWEDEFVKNFFKLNKSSLLSYKWETMRLVKEYGKLEVEKLNGGSKKDELEEKSMVIASDISKNLSLRTRSHLINSLPSGTRYCGYAMILCDQLEKEYEVKTASQRMIVQKIVSAEVRLLYYQGFAGETLTSSTVFATITERARAELHINKIIDTAHRQIQSGIEQLKAMTTPPMKIKFTQEQVSSEGAVVSEKKKVVQEFSNPKNNDPQ